MARVGSLVAAPVDGGAVRVVRLLGEGGQGAVFEVVVPSTGERLAMKWYHPRMAPPAQRLALELLVERGAPSGAFLWPTAVVSAPPDDGRAVGPAGGWDGGFGYLMPLRPERFRGVADLLAGRVDVPYSVAVSLCLHLAHSFLLLHSLGLCYRDISFGNVMFDPADGSVLVCDCDNVGVDGASTSTVLGTRRFMAPEVVRGEAGPSTQTDLFSLAVLLFYVLMVGHPLIGRRELDFAAQDVARAETALFGTSPLFVFDPHDDANAPDPSLHGAVAENWARYPAGVRDLFTQSFTRGLVDPRHGRVRESVWRRVLVALRDRIAQCSACGAEHFFDPATAPAGSGDDRPRAAPPPCWACGEPTAPPLRLVFDDKVLVLSESTRVASHHVRHDYDLATVVGEVARHPTLPGRWGLRNASAVAWRVVLPTGAALDVGPGRTVGLVPGALIDFGGPTAVLRC